MLHTTATERPTVMEVKQGRKERGSGNKVAYTICFAVLCLMAGTRMFCTHTGNIESISSGNIGELKEQMISLAKDMKQMNERFASTDTITKTSRDNAGNNESVSSGNIQELKGQMASLAKEMKKMNQLEHPGPV